MRPAWSALGISPSYLNQLEHNTRPLTVPVLLKMTEVFSVDPTFFASTDTGRLIADMMTGATPFTDPAPYRAERFG